MAEKLDYFKLKARYEFSSTDAETVVTSVVRGGKRKTVSNCGGGPTELWAFERLVESELAAVRDWKHIPH